MKGAAAASDRDVLILAAFAAGVPIRRIARGLGTSHTTVGRVLARYRERYGAGPVFQRGKSHDLTPIRLRDGRRGKNGPPAAQ